MSALRIISNESYDSTVFQTCSSMAKIDAFRSSTQGIMMLWQLKRTQPPILNIDFVIKKQNTNATNLTFRLDLNTADDVTQLSVELA